ncbi:MAG: trypsin-like peptidase domain-containing protein [Clostridia bacterium]|nr:trypsin-like peptidase domain-containing protein [Clostridia bacterium]
MNQNDWYEQQNSNVQNGYNGYQDHQQNHSGYYGDPAPKKQKKGITVTAGILVVCILAAALIGGGVGALAVSLANGMTQPIQESLLDAQPSAAPEESAEPSSPAETPSESIQKASGILAAELSVKDVAAKCMPSIVGIDIEIQQVSSYYGDMTATGSGSGVIFTEDGYIVTNNHVIDGATAIKVYLQDGTSYPAKLIGADERTDLAVIKIDAENLIPATLGSSSDLSVGDAVIAIGNPLGELMSTVTGGWISGLNRTIMVDDYEMSLMQTDAAVNPGNSGGGLFNSQGELIGIVNAKSMGYDVEGLGFAIPIDSALNIITDLMDQGYVSGRPYLGVSMQEVYVTSGNRGDRYGFPFMQQGYYQVRVQLAAIAENGAADKAGLQVGDMILAVDDTTVEGVDHLINLIGAYNAGDTVTLTVQRGTEMLTVTVTLEERTGA